METVQVKLGGYLRFQGPGVKGEERVLRSIKTPPIIIRLQYHLIDVLPISFRLLLTPKDALRRDMVLF